MNRKLPWFFMLLSFLFLAGCSSESLKSGSGYVKHITYIDNATKTNGAIIRVDGAHRIWRVDGVRKVNVFKTMQNKGLTEVVVKEGYHTITCLLQGGNFKIGRTLYEAGHKYTISVRTKFDGRSTTVHYWVKDNTTNEVVFGKEAQ